MRGSRRTVPATSGSTSATIPPIVEPTDAIARVAAACVCGSDLWPYPEFDSADSSLIRH